MKRFHVHVSVDNLDEAVRFYSSVFGVMPSVTKPDYAKWMLEDPRVNFAISNRGHAAGVNHLGIQVESNEELEQLRSRLGSAGSNVVVEQTGVSCCYSRSDKYWITDPAGIAWETFRSLESVPTYGEGTRQQAAPSTSCIPIAAAKPEQSELGDAGQNETGSCCG